MKKQLKNFVLFGWLMMSVLTLSFLASCGDDDDGTDPGNEEEPIASFQFEISEEDFLEVTFTNYSQNATVYEWNFGDGNSSEEENPTHTYAEAGSYEVTLTATNADGSATKTETVTLTDPNSAMTMLAGEESKTWKLFREGTSMALLGSSLPDAQVIWAGLTNNGARPCSYQQTFTFTRDGQYIFDDAGSFWAEYGVFNNVADCDANVTPESCFDATSENMVNACGDDVSAWLSGTHSYTYNVSQGEITLSGDGAWIGVPKLGTDAGDILTPQSSVTFKVSFTEHEGYDVMKVEFEYEGNYWPIYYVSYSDASLEPDLVTDQAPFGEDLENISPESLSHTFESAESFELLGTLGGGSIITPGVDDPADATAAKVGQFDRVAIEYQEAQIRISPDPKDIVFDNLSTISIDVYLPSTNDYSGTLTQNIVVGFGDVSATEQWWTDLYQWEATDVALDEWVTLTFDLDTPAHVAAGDGTTPFDRDDLDMFYIGIGGGGHTTAGTFYIRNLVIE